MLVWVCVCVCLKFQTYGGDGGLPYHLFQSNKLLREKNGKIQRATPSNRLPWMDIYTSLCARVSLKLLRHCHSLRLLYLMGVRVQNKGKLLKIYQIMSQWSGIEHTIYTFLRLINYTNECCTTIWPWHWPWIFLLS